MTINEQVLKTVSDGRCNVELLKNGGFFYCQDGQRIQWAHSRAESADGRQIDTRSAVMGTPMIDTVESELGIGQRMTVSFSAEALELTRIICIYGSIPCITVQLVLRDTRGETVTRYLAPIDTPYPSPEGHPLLLSLDQKLLLLPYDNDMWVRYESVPLRPGRVSYDAAAIYHEDNREGLVIGALDHLVWKNAVVCSGTDARSVTAFSGVADAGTHDFVPHACVRGDSVASARFVMRWTQDIREGMECFGSLCARVHPPMQWEGSIPFGYNTFSGLGGMLTMDNWQRAGDLIHAELPDFGDEQGVTYINLDAYFNQDEERITEMVKAFHDRGQKVGTYAAPFVGHERLGLDRPLFGSDQYTFRDLLLKDDRGRVLPAPDGLHPLDITHPAWEGHVRAWMRHIVGMGFDYLKIDFLSHGAMEGAHYNKAVTGRMALTRGYEIINDELSKAERPIFLSLSIAPLFPHGFGHARRCCCDSFGHTEDVRYVLNALNFAWWTQGRLYSLNDPDHIVLYRSIIDGRDATLPEEARSRYNAAAISGTVMLLSDNYGPNGDAGDIADALARAKVFATNPDINAVARRRKAFRPVELRDGTTPVFVSVEEDGVYAAFFNYRREPQTISVLCSRAGLPLHGKVRDLNHGTVWQTDSVVSVSLAPMDSAILKWID